MLSGFMMRGIGDELEGMYKEDVGRGMLVVIFVGLDEVRTVISGIKFGGATIRVPGR
jgi:hypothetical protein